MLALLASLLLADCNAPVGTEALLARPERVIVVGEVHGTNEAPEAFAGIVCEAARLGPVTVALEYPAQTQPTLEAFIEAPEAIDAMSALSGDAFFHRVADGRTSEAMAQLLFELQALRWEGRDVVVRTLQPATLPPSSLSQAWYELDMAHLLAAAVVERPSARVLVLVGNLHARKTPYPDWDNVGVPAAGHLPAEDTITLNVASQGGESWSCQPECGVHGGPGWVDASLRGLILEPTPDGAFDGVLALGPSTASPPVPLNPLD